MSASSEKLLGYQGGNPFRESQARDYPNPKVLQEFFPTNAYRSLFNEQNEILIGTRGSGKTILLRMLTYSSIREVKDDPALRALTESKQYLGFYIPLHLELIRRIHRSPDKSIQYFAFTLNCSAAEALLTEVRALLNDCFSDPYDRREKESQILKSLNQAWNIPFQTKPSCLEDFQWELNTYYAQTPQWEDTTDGSIPTLAQSVLMPIRGVLGRIAQLLGLAQNHAQWIACIDEAEFLPESYIKALNTFMRSEKRPLTIKIATLPFAHSTRDTLDPRIKIEPDGNDFNYRKIDYDPDGDDFKKLTDHITRTRLSKCQIEAPTLEDFLGLVGKDEGLDYYKLEFGDAESSQERILEKIGESLSPTRRERFKKYLHDPSVMSQQYLKKFSPVLYVREMKQADRKGNRSVGWFAGAKIARRVADGNSRRFLQLMNEFFQEALEKKLTPRHQHRVVWKFSNRTNDAVAGLPRYGLLAKEVVDCVGKVLSDRAHGPVIAEAGCDFRIDDQLLQNDDLCNAVKTAIAYSHIILPENVIENIDGDTRLRLSFLQAVCFWLPMRKGDPVPKLKAEALSNPPVMEDQQPTAEEIELHKLQSLQLTLQFAANDETDQA